MAKRGDSTGMTGLEKILGGVLLAVYLWVLPLAAGPLFDLVQRAFSVSIGDALREAVRYYILFGLTAVFFGNYLVRMGRAFLNHAGQSLCAVGIGLVAFYGCNELLRRCLRLFSASPVNWNDQAITVRLHSAPGHTILIVVFLAPVIEEVIFRGFVFGNLREYSRGGAYLISGLLFALVHIWPYFAGGWSVSCLPMILSYLAPGLVMTWTFERSDSIWGSILLHAVVNGFAVWSVF